MSDIANTYDPALNQNAGFDVLTPGAQPLGADGKTLLRLLYWLTYTADGRQFLRANITFGPNAVAEPQIRANLTAQFAAFNVVNAVILEAMIQTHLAADRWIEANQQVVAGDASKVAVRDTQELIYKQNLSVVTWWLWQDALNHEFSMLW
jgi:hypothetical protein